MARKSRIWKGARTPSALKRARQALRRRAVNRRTRSEAKTLVLQAASVASGRSEGDAAGAVAAAISALDKAAEKGIIHPNNAARRARPAGERSSAIARARRRTPPLLTWQWRWAPVRSRPAA